VTDRERITGKVTGRERALTSERGHLSILSSRALLQSRQTWCHAPPDPIPRKKAALGEMKGEKTLSREKKKGGEEMERGEYPGQFERLARGLRGEPGKGGLGRELKPVRDRTLPCVEDGYHMTRKAVPLESSFLCREKRLQFGGGAGPVSR